ncbi:MAG: DUF6754 domain-containing protein [Oscillochloridaceae bacterium umkhey_bin13]
MLISPDAVIILLVVLVVVALTWLHHARVSNGRLPSRRPLAALDRLRAALGRGAETGRPVHVSSGASALGAAEGTRASTAELIAGLLVAERVVGEAALNGAPISVTSGDAVAHLALRGAVRQAYQVAGQAQDYNPNQIQLLAHHDEFAFATGVTALYARQPLEASVMVGAFNQEFLLIGEEGNARELPQVAGTTSTVALPLMLLTTPATLIGEEVFAAEAYLSSQSSAQARLLTQDVLRTTVIVLLIVGLAYSLLQPSLGLPALPLL